MTVIKENSVSETYRKKVTEEVKTMTKEQMEDALRKYCESRPCCEGCGVDPFGCFWIPFDKNFTKQEIIRLYVTMRKAELMKPPEKTVIKENGIVYLCAGDEREPLLSYLRRQCEADECLYPKSRELGKIEEHIQSCVEERPWCMECMLYKASMQALGEEK